MTLQPTTDVHSIAAAIKAIGLGVTAFIEKPLNPSVLREVVKRALEQRDAELTSGEAPRKTSDHTLFYG